MSFSMPGVRPGVALFVLAMPNSAAMSMHSAQCQTNTRAVWCCRCSNSNSN
jgi:hypothetical protein